MSVVFPAGDINYRGLSDAQTMRHGSAFRLKFPALRSARMTKLTRPEEARDDRHRHFVGHFDGATLG